MYVYIIYMHIYVYIIINIYIYMIYKISDSFLCLATMVSDYLDNSRGVKYHATN